MFEDITIRQYINAMYKDDRSVMNNDELSLCYTEYIDTAGLYETDDFNKSAYISFLHNRINTITISIKLQKEFLKEFNIAYLPGLVKFKKYGHSVKWSHEEKFLKDLESIESREKKYISQLETAIKELNEMRQKKSVPPEQQKIPDRGKFIRTINSLGKLNFKIDNDKTTMEELAYMIKQQIEDNK